jgi:hypothetical protein
MAVVTLKITVSGNRVNLALSNGEVIVNCYKKQLTFARQNRNGVDYFDFFIGNNNGRRVYSRESAGISEPSHTGADDLANQLSTLLS